MRICNQRITTLLLIFSFLPHLAALDDYQQVTFQTSIFNCSFNTSARSKLSQQEHSHAEIDRYCANDKEKYIDNLILNTLTPQTIIKLCTKEQEQYLFLQYHLYSNTTYLNYLRSCPGYESFILGFYEKIQQNHAFRKSLRYVPGFKRKREFLLFIDHEKTIINDRRKERELKEHTPVVQAKKTTRSALDIDISEKLRDLFMQQCSLISVFKSPDRENRYMKRIAAITKTHNQNFQKRDYSQDIDKQSIIDDYQKLFDNHYGTELDKLLHEELCDIRKKALVLSLQHGYDFHVQHGIPLVQYYAALAKSQSNLAEAFNLSDIVYDLMEALSAGANLIARAVSVVGQGAFCAVKTTLSTEHWKQMAHGIASIGSVVLQQIRKQNELDHILWAKNPQVYHDILHKHHQETKAHIEAIKNHYHVTLAALKSMTWDELLKQSVELGTGMILDTLLLSVGSSLISKVGSEVIAEAAYLLKTEGTIASEYAAEVAGFGKITLEQGFGVAEDTLKAMETNPIQNRGLALSEKYKANVYRVIEKTGNIESNIRNIQSWANINGWVQNFTDGGVEMWGIIKKDGVFSWRVKIKREPSLRVELGSGSKRPRCDVRIDEGVYYNPFLGETGGKSVGTHISLEL